MSVRSLITKMLLDRKPEVNLTVIKENLEAGIKTDRIIGRLLFLIVQVPPT